MGSVVVYALYVAIFFTFLMAGYLFARKRLFGGRSMIVLYARIDKIHITKLGGIYSPEVLVDYHFYYLSERYTGSDFIRLDLLAPGKDLLLSDRNGFPVLSDNSREYTGEEHIEMYILEHTQQVLVEFHVSSLPLSRIHKEQEEKKTLFQNVSIDFPWSR